MKRILILGPCGAGKSTLARALAPALSLPLIHLDQEYWQPGWTEPAADAWRSHVTRLVMQERWLMEGNFASTLDLRIPRADTVIVLDLPPRIYRFRVLTRIAKSHGRVRPDMAPGCPERLDLGFLRYVWRFHHSYRPLLVEAVSRCGPQTTLHWLKTRQEIAALTATITE